MSESGFDLLRDYNWSAKDTEFKIFEKKLMKEELDRCRKKTNAQIMFIAYTTGSFRVGFTMPGGYPQNREPDEEKVLLSKKTAFNAFVTTYGCIVFGIIDIFSFSLVDCIFTRRYRPIVYTSTVLNIISVMAMMLTFITGTYNIVSVIAMMLTFITGTYVVLSHSPALAVIVVN